MFLLSLYQKNTTKTYQNFLKKGLKYQFIEMDITQKVRIEILQIGTATFLGKTF